MKHVKVRWLQSDPDYPIWIYSELDDERREVRKVEIFPDGSYHCVSDAEQPDDEARTQLSPQPWPPLSDIEADPEFELGEISAAEFEAVWTKARGG